MDQRRMMRAYSHFKLFQVNRAVQFMVCNNHANFFLYLQLMSARRHGIMARETGLLEH